MKVNLNHYVHSYVHPNFFIRIIWIFLSRIFFESHLPYPIKLKIIILKLFGAEVGEHIIIKPSVKIKYPWNLKVGHYSWIGEEVWIDNLAYITIEDNCCISQGAMLLTGNHDYSSSTFDLIIDQITLKSGSWVGAKSVVCPGVVLGENAVLSVGSVATKNLEKNNIYQGNPAVKKKLRVIS